MNYMEIWNAIVRIYEETKNSPENVIQDKWENICKEFLHYSSLNNEIDTKRSIHYGSKDKVIPDIILRNNKRDSVVIELKQYSLIKNDLFAQQLFSYLKQLKVKVGVLICNKIYLFLYDYTLADNQQQYIEIDLTKDNITGEEFVKHLDNYNFSIDTITNFIVEQNKVLKEVEELKRMTTVSYIKEILKEKFINEKYTEEAINKLFNSMQIDVKQKNIKEFLDEGLRPPIGIEKITYNQKSKAIKICSDNNISITQYVTYAKKSSNYGKYPANVNQYYLKNDWTLILDDVYSKKLHVFIIPKNTFNYNNFIIRKDNNKIVLGIDSAFNDEHNFGICNSFFDYKVATLDY